MVVLRLVALVGWVRGEPIAKGRGKMKESGILYPPQDVEVHDLPGLLQEQGPPGLVGPCGCNQGPRPSALSQVAQRATHRRHGGDGSAHGTAANASTTNKF